MAMDHLHHFNEITVAISESEEHQHHQHGTGDPEEAFKTWVSILIAVSAIAIAAIVWASGILGNHGGAQNTDGVAAAVKDQAADLAAKSTAIEDSVGYLAYRRDNTLAVSISDFLEDHPELPASTYDLLNRQRTEAWDVGIGINSFFGQRWASQQLDKGGKLTESYGSDREYQSLLSNSRNHDDLDSDAHVAQARQERDRALDLIIGMPIFGATIWLLTLAYDADKRARLFPTVVACLIFVGGSVWSLYVYFLR
jgi:hypothetical protein